MNTWPESIPAYLHNTAMGEAMRRKQIITVPITQDQMMDLYRAPRASFAPAKSPMLAEPLATGAAIKAKRIEIGMSQTEVAQALDCTASNISQIEGRETVDRKTDLAFRAIFAAKQANQE